MKKSIVVLVMGLCATAVFAQDANTQPTVQKEQPQENVKLKHKLKVNETKNAAVFQESATRTKADDKKVMPMHNTLVEIKPEEK